ncbi:UNVERIFIED_CONTAM: hypothetical protein PYX00_004554 [Menopon gallinae]|uniref:Adiponectin receptor 2 n=1 Tax=Menopon gallinae TaxID=328185 RepID=A0AAW2I4Y8_9NEOP
MSDYEDAIESADDSTPMHPINKNTVRHRPTPLPLWDPDELSLSDEYLGINEVKQELLEEDDGSGLDEEEDGVGCPLPSTPVEQCLLHTEIAEVIKVGLISDEIDLGALGCNATEKTEEFIRKVWEFPWKNVSYRMLPQWLQDNDYIHSGHRPPLPSYLACFKSIFRLHTETGNIWTHLLGCVAFMGMAPNTLLSEQLKPPEKIVFAVYFLGAIICLGLSSAYHTVYCHSECVGKLFSKLDYCGIAIQIMGSFVPWLYYGFYCRQKLILIYLSIEIILCITSIVVSLWDRFSLPRYRPLRTGVFMFYGLSGIIPAVHHTVSEGWPNAVYQASLGWIILMGLLYILGATVYTLRVPERFFPGKCDIWNENAALTLVRKNLYTGNLWPSDGQLIDSG